MQLQLIVRSGQKKGKETSHLTAKDSFRERSRLSDQTFLPRSQSASLRFDD